MVGHTLLSDLYKGPKYYKYYEHNYTLYFGVEGGQNGYWVLQSPLHILITHLGLVSL